MAPGPLRGLLAVALVTAREAVRTRLVLAVGVTLALGALLLFLGAAGDGTPAGRLRVLLSWGLSFDALLVLLATVFLSTSVATDVRDGRAAQVLSAPLRREGFVAGRWLGAASVLGALLVASALLLLGLVALASRDAASDEERSAVEQVLAARASRRPAPPDPAMIEVEVRSRLAELRAERRVPAGMDEDDVRALLEEEAHLRRRSVDRRSRRAWRVTGLEGLAPDAVAVLRFRYQARTEPGVLRPGEGPRGRFTLLPGSGERVEPVEGTWLEREFHELAIPAWALGTSGAIDVAYENLEDRPVVVLFPEHGVEVLVPSGGFGPNLLRAALVLLGRVLFLAALGVAVATLIDGNLAAVVVVFVLALGSGHEFLVDALRPVAYGALDAPLKAVLVAVLWVVPDLGRDDLSGLLADGRRVEWASVWTSLVEDGLLRGGVLLGLGGALFARRELGAVR